MQGRTLNFGQVYLETSKDKDGNYLDGGKTYRLHVEPNAPVGQFWSITLYDNVTRGPVITDQGAADMSLRKPDLVTNSDGSVDVYFGPEKPANATKNSWNVGHGLRFACNSPERPGKHCEYVLMRCAVGGQMRSFLVLSSEG